MMRTEDYKRRKPLALTPLREEFINKINRLLYHYGSFKRGWQRLERDDLLILHNNGVMSVDLGPLQVVKYTTDGHRRATWCSNKDLKKAMAEIDAMFVLDDLAKL